MEYILFMNVEIDQSGKIEQLNTATTVGMSNGIQLAIKINVTDKQKLFFKLRRSLIPRNNLYPIIFSIMIFFLLRKLNKIPSKIVIDEEYSGKEQLIEQTINKLFENNKIACKSNIIFKQIGKHSLAHDVAWATHSKIKRNKYKFFKIGSEDILKYLK